MTYDIYHVEYMCQYEGMSNNRGCGEMKAQKVFRRILKCEECETNFVIEVENEGDAEQLNSEDLCCPFCGENSLSERRLKYV